MGLEAVDYYDPPNLTFPFGSYICVVDIDKGTGQVHVRRFVAVDDCGNIINPMIVDGQIHGGLNMGLAPSLYEEITYDELGNNMAGTFMDYLLPTAVETPGLGDRQDHHAIAASPDRRQGGGGVGDRRRPAGHRQRRRRCPVAPRRPQHRHPDHAPEGLGDPAREGHLLGADDRAFDLRAGRRARGGGSVVRGRHGRGGPAADLGPARARAASSIRTARSRAGSAAAAPSPSSSARRCARSSTASRACSGSRRTRPAEGRRGDGVIELVMTCHSGGTLEIYVEPHLPAPVLWVAGTTPIAGALVALGLGRRLARDRHRPDRRRRRVPGRRAGPRHGRPQRLDPEVAPYVVVATQGVWDEEAIGRRARARRRVRRSRRRRRRGPASSATWLREEAAVPEERIAALRAPAGLDLGAETAEEVALSILAELVQVRRGRADFVAAPGPATVAGASGRARRAPAGRRRHRAARPGLRHDRGPGARAPPRRARRGRLRVLLDRLPDAVHPRAHRLRPGVGILAGLTRRPRLVHHASARRHRMHFEGSVPIKASREKVWAFVIDPDQVGQCGPGVEKIEVIDDTHFKATAKVGIGFISARFNVEHDVRRARRPGQGGHQGARPGARQRGRRRRRA